MRNFQTEKSTTVTTSTKTGTDAMIRTSHNVSIGFASLLAPTGNQSISSPAAMPSADAMRPTASICRQSARASGRSGPGPWLTETSPQAPWRRHPMRARRRTPLCRRRADALSGPEGRAEAVRTASQRLRMTAAAGASVGAEVRWGDALVAAERLRELGRLAVADPVGDLTDRQR